MVSSAREGSTSAEATVRLGERSGAPVATDAPPAKLGRYVVLEQVGAGGMGRVLRAYDPKLRREVALKLLAPRMQESDGSARIVREAQAMAQLSHPNLVPVYDVDRDGDALFIAMEYVEGDTLRRWLAQPRSWREVVQAFLGAGRGLAAAHAAGIVHRDFKPSNAIVATDGRVRVMDFGLARGTVARPLDSLEENVDDLMLSELTQSGVVIGTLPYMAPEQHDGVAAIPASDQYAFCVALWEGLYGARPFTAEHAKALAAVKKRGVPTAPAGSRVPRWLHAAVVRGLAVDPVDRWPSMEALLSVLERGQVRPGAGRALVIAGSLGLMAGGIVLVQQIDVRRRTAACERAGAEIDAIWNDDRRTGLRNDLGAATADRVLPWLDAYAQAWQDARTESCLDHGVRDTWNTDILDRSLWCLDERRLELESLLDEMARADGVHVAPAVARLTSVDGCRDADLLARLPAPPTEHVEEIRAIRSQLARTVALERTGEYAEALELARVARAQAEAVGWPPLVAAALTEEATSREDNGDYEGAARLAAQAYFAAARVDAWDIAARAASEALFVTGYRLARHDEGRQWAEHAAIALARTGDPGQLQEAARLHRLAQVEGASGAHAEARTLHERALALQEATLGPDHLGLTSGLANLANTHAALDDHDGAIALHERALAIREAALGPDHHVVATSLNDLGSAHWAAGHRTKARELCERSLAIDSAALGPDHPDVAVSLMNVAVMSLQDDETERAKQLFERALVIFEAAHGPDHPLVAASLGNLGVLHLALGETARAGARLERALRIQEKLLGVDHLDTARVRQALASYHSAVGAHAKAHEEIERVLAIRTKTLGRDAPDVAQSLALRAEYERAAGDERAARRTLAEAMPIFEQHEGWQLSELDATFLLAELLAREDPKRARTLATRARDGWREQRNADRVREVEAWLRRQSR